MERLTIKKWFKWFRPDEETTALCVDGYTQIVVNDGEPYDNQHYFLVGEAVDKLADYEEAEEQGLLLRLPVVVIDVVDKLFSHNEIVNLWIERKNEISYHELVWSGMAWDIPEVLKNCNFIKIFGTIPMAISEADHINIEIALTEEAEVALEKLKGEEHEENVT